MKIRYEIVEKRPYVPDEEIEALKDFDSLLARHKAGNSDAVRWDALLKKFFPGLGAIIGIGIILYGVTTFQDRTKATEDGSKEVGERVSPGLQGQVTDATPATELPAPAEVEDPTEKAEKNSPALVLPQAKSSDSSTLVHPEDSETLEEQETSEIEDNHAQYTYTDAEPVKGLVHLYEYFERELQYPAEATADSVEGTLIVLFTISREGSIGAISIENSLGSAFEEEAKRLIGNMPAWKPATVNDEPVDSKVSIPLHFRIQK